MRWAFARFYRELAWTYDTVAALVSGGHWFEWVRAAMPHLHGQVLELGPGTGHLQRALASAFVPTFGLDTSPQMLSITRARLHRNMLPTRLVRGLAQALPFQPSAFDTVVATFPTEYIVDGSTLAEVRRVLRPGGRLVIVLAAGFAADGPYERAVDLLYRITLQRSPRAQSAGATQSATLRRLNESGFAASERWEPAGGGQVHLLVASPHDRDQQPVI